MTRAETLILNGRKLEYRVRTLRSAQRLRLRVGPNGIEIIEPLHCDPRILRAFIKRNATWIDDRVGELERMGAIRRLPTGKASLILFGGVATPVHVRENPFRSGPNVVTFGNDGLVIERGRRGAEPSSSLENWLRRQARAAFNQHLKKLARLKRRQPKQLYVMGQRTKWGNCSAGGIVSLNWRLIMAPDAVVRYLVTHEVVHLSIPDHSQKFWLTLTSYAPDAERARQWLCANAHRLMVDLREVVKT